MEASAFGNHIRLLRKKAKMTIRQLELYSGVSNAYLSQLENGKRGTPSPDILRKLADPLGVPYAHLMKVAGYVDTIDTPSYTENTNGHAYIGVRSEVRELETQRVPVLGKIRAGFDLYADSQVMGVAFVETRLMSEGEEYFCLLVEGDSMEGDSIFDGDTVLVQRQKWVDNGKIGIVIVNGDEACLKHVWYQEDGTVNLVSSNPKYPPRNLREDDLHILGQAIHRFPKGNEL